MSQSDDLKGEWASEGGADAAANLLAHYDKQTGTWDLPRTGELWDAVHQAWNQGSHGEDVTIAVIDDGFDTSFPELANQRVPWTSPHNGRFVHGTAVALLILSVAPKARLILYSVARLDGWDVGLIAAALKHSLTTKCAILNLSLGKAYPTEQILNYRAWAATIEPWPDLRKDDILFMVTQSESQLSGWRELICMPETALKSEIAEVADSGRTIVVAAGNVKGYLYEPAIFPDVYSASFNSGRNPNPENMIERERYMPSASNQSEYSDFSVLQPPDALGTSFAAPLIAGFAALMHDPCELENYREMDRLSGLASELVGQFVVNNPNMWEKGIDRWILAIDDIYDRAIQRLPHTHTSQNTQDGCPECFYFATGTFGNYGIYKMNMGILGKADEVLSKALIIAPNDVHVLLVIGRLRALQADRFARNKDINNVISLLKESCYFLEKGLALKEFARDRELLTSIKFGIEFPFLWRLPPTYEGW